MFPIPDNSIVKDIEKEWIGKKIIVVDDKDGCIVYKNYDEEEDDE